MKIRIDFFNFSRNRTKKLSKEEQKFESSINKLVGYRVKNLDLFKEAFTLRSSTSSGNSNYERLEYLGDSVLGALVSCFLFRIYTNSREGFLSQMKSKVVNRQNLNYIGKQLNLIQYLQNIDENTKLGENIYGSIFEALVGAIYIDTDYKKCCDIVLKRFITKDYILKLEDKVVSYKSLLLEWGHKEKLSLKIDTQEDSSGVSRFFYSHIWMEGCIISKASEYSKKKAEEKAAQRAFYLLQKKEKFRKWLESKK